MGDESRGERAFQLESRLTNHGCYLSTFERTEEVYRIEYESMAGDAQGQVPPREAGRIVNVVRDLVDERDWPLGGIEATATDLGGKALVRWRADAEWMRRLEEGDLSEVEFSQKVVDSFEAVD